jgi:hypothetical protein
MCIQWNRLLVNDEKLRDQTNVANGFSNFFITITEKLNIQHTEKGDAISVLKDSFPLTFPSTEIIPIVEAEVKSIYY